MLSICELLLNWKEETRIRTENAAGVETTTVARVYLAIDSRNASYSSIRGKSRVTHEYAKQT